MSYLRDGPPFDETGSLCNHHEEWSTSALHGVGDDLSGPGDHHGRIGAADCGCGLRDDDAGDDYHDEGDDARSRDFFDAPNSDARGNDDDLVERELFHTLSRRWH